MVLKNVVIAVIGAAFLGWSGLAAAADQYQPDQFLGLDLATAVLSPKLLGPVTAFGPVAIEARTDHISEANQARAEPPADAQIVVPKIRLTTRVAHRAQPRGAARTRLARHQNPQGTPHGNPLDAEAFDTRIQVWPCKSGGICNWQR
jgi:hypothetical protein